jgi:hypothetical protein
MPIAFRSRTTPGAARSIISRQKLRMHSIRPVETRPPTIAKTLTTGQLWTAYVGFESLSVTNGLFSCARCYGTTE